MNLEVRFRAQGAIILNERFLLATCMLGLAAGRWAISVGDICAVPGAGPGS